MQDVFVFPCELGDKERGKYMHKVGTEMVGVKKKKIATMNQQLSPTTQINSPSAGQGFT